jgi:succinate dehydrogenase hydrophobic anchor subunit
VGNSALDIHYGSNVLDEIFNYFFAVSILILITWLLYYLFRKRLVENKWIWVHLFSNIIVLLFVAKVRNHYLPGMPRRYYDYSPEFFMKKLLGSNENMFYTVAFFLAASQIFLYINLKSKKKIIKY